MAQRLILQPLDRCGAGRKRFLGERRVAKSRVKTALLVPGELDVEFVGVEVVEGGLDAGGYDQVCSCSAKHQALRINPVLVVRPAAGFQVD